MLCPGHFFCRAQFAFDFLQILILKITECYYIPAKQTSSELVEYQTQSFPQSVCISKYHHKENNMPVVSVLARVDLLAAAQVLTNSEIINNTITWILLFEILHDCN